MSLFVAKCGGMRKDESEGKAQEKHEFRAFLLRYDAHWITGLKNRRPFVDREFKSRPLRQHKGKEKIRRSRISGKESVGQVRTDADNPTIPLLHEG